MEGEARTYKSVWEDLSSVDCSDHVQEKMGLTYLSWAWAHGMMMTKYPDHRVAWKVESDDGSVDEGYVDGVLYHPDRSATVSCRVMIPVEGGDDLYRDMWLPVMDHKNNAINNPTARHISDAKMRCFVKAFAMFGLGHYIYAGEDLPNDPERERKVESLIQAIRTDGIKLRGIVGEMPKKVMTDAKKAIMSRKPENLEKVLSGIRSDLAKAEKKAAKEAAKDEDKSTNGEQDTSPTTEATE